LVGYVSVGCCGIFRTTVEDNIAVATTREVTSAEVREVCRKVGAHETFLQLPVR
jgi:ABC-type multidrug transport system fused ATPase/permease subunit